MEQPLEPVRFRLFGLPELIDDFLDALDGSFFSRGRIHDSTKKIRANAETVRSLPALTGCDKGVLAAPIRRLVFDNGDHDFIFSVVKMTANP